MESNENKKTKLSKNRIDSNNKWTKANYESINLAIPKGTKEVWRQKATGLGYNSLNGFIKAAVNEKIEREES